MDGDLCSQFFDLNSAVQKRICNETDLDDNAILDQLCSLQSGM